MAKIAGHRDVEAGQREGGLVVVKDRAQPRGRRMTGRASSWITRSYVIWYRPAKRRGALPGGRVTTVAIGWHGGVIVIHVARRAGHGHVRAGQRENCRVVVESRAQPARRGMADRAVCREPCRNMIRHPAAKRRSALPGSDVATVAGG